MCWSAEMESYEEFCLRSLAFLQEEGKLKKSTCEPLCSLKTQSVILIHGRVILSPLLTAEQRHMMCNYRRQAVQLEVERQNQQRNRLLARVQDLLDKAQIQTSGEVGKVPSGKCATVSEYTLVTDSPGLPKDSGSGLQTNDQPAAPFSETCLINCYKTVGEEKLTETEEKSEEENDEDEEEEDFSLDSLLKKSREYVKQEQKVVHTVQKSPPDNGPDLNSKSCNSMRDPCIEFGFSLHHSPVGQPNIQHQPLYDSNLPQSGSVSPGFPNQQICLPDKDFSDFSTAPSAHKRRPRPVSTGNIHISFPIEPADLIPRSPGRSGDGVADWDLFQGTARSSHHRGSLGNEYRDRVNRGVDSQSIHWSTSPVQEICSPESNSGSSPTGHLDCVSTQFRRRCHTLDSHQQTGHSAAKHIDRSQERVPRFMAGVTWLGPNRRLPADPVNQSYNTENASPSMLRPSVTPDLSQIKLRMEPNEPQSLNNSKLTLNAFRNTPEAQTNKSGKEGALRQAQALEDMQRHLEDEQALQMSQLLAEQEREQQRLCLEHEQAERRMKEQVCRRPLSADASGWNSDSCPIISPSCPRLSPAHTPSERTPGHSIGFPSPVSSIVSSPSIQSPIYVWGPVWTGNKPQARLSLVMTSEQQRAFCRISAITRGFLIRRLLKTEKVKHLRQTILDTQEFIRSLQTEVPQKRVTYSTQDLSLQERVRAQLRAALYDIHDIFFQMPLPQRLALLQQDRELRLERKLRDMEKPKSPKEKVVLSAATQRSLDRKKRASGSPAPNRKMQQKPKSPTTNRVLKPSQGQNSPASGQLNRQGSWYKKTPEERVRRSDCLKKQHSLG